MDSSQGITTTGASCPCSVSCLLIVGKCVQVVTLVPCAESNWCNAWAHEVWAQFRALNCCASTMHTRQWQESFGRTPATSWHHRLMKRAMYHIIESHVACTNLLYKAWWLRLATGQLHPALGASSCSKFPLISSVLWQCHSVEVDSNWTTCIQSKMCSEFIVMRQFSYSYTLIPQLGQTTSLRPFILTDDVMLIGVKLYCVFFFICAFRCRCALSLLLSWCLMLLLVCHKTSNLIVQFSSACKAVHNCC